MIRFPIPPMIHGATQSATWMSLFSGQTTVLAPEFDADEVWRTIHDHKVNLLFFTGDAMARPLLDALLAHQEKGNEYDLSSLFLLASTAALFSTSIKEKFLELLPNRIITDSIGSSETGFGGTSIVAKGESHTGGPRVTIDKHTVVLDEDGNEVVPGFGRARHHRQDAATSRSATTRTRRRRPRPSQTINGVRYAIPGDYAEVEADGSVTMLGRGSVSINSGGEKIYPEEVEAALKGHPDVFDALVVGVPDPRFGQHVAAVVQAREGARPTLAELDAFVRNEIAGYKVPRSLWLVDEVKRSPAGKPDYRWAKDQTEASARRRGARQPCRGARPDAYRTLRPLRHRVPDLRLHAVGEGGRRGQQGRRPGHAWAASGSTTPTTSSASCSGWTPTPTASRTASTS